MPTGLIAKMKTKMYKEVRLMNPNSHREFQDQSLTRDRSKHGRLQLCQPFWRFRKHDASLSKDKHTVGKTFSGKLLDFPIPYKVTAPGESLTNEEIVEATHNPRAKEDIETIHFINFPDDFSQNPEARATLVHTQELVESWQAWTSSLCEGKVQEIINGGHLSDKDTFAAMSERETELASGKHIECKKVELHTKILTAVLKGFMIPTSVFQSLEVVLYGIVDGIALSRRISPVVRVISFRTTAETAKYVVGKSSYESVKFDLSFGQYQARFVSKIYEGIVDSVDKELIEAGKELTKIRTEDINVPV
ncbi:uncharacterized protein KY384_006729 [Bacidia gigantensis]|uniref:uncharacterized protein n=1 Tax=Bacidia gigantensis TaxID=2732470 RepID=UPI001D036BA9|nr:uncharacterized protein KY384_006729 [Bacidia gigantensis]KAG8528557.1 hypothetical protein KY384_006729 [Bacidia gigantensis]